MESLLKHASLFVWELPQNLLGASLYLPLVGIPSALRAVYAMAYRELTGSRWQRYYDGYPEDWADRLGGVRRPPRP